MAVALVVGAAIYYWRYRRAGQRYKLVNRFNIDDEDDDGDNVSSHTFPEQDNRLGDDEDHHIDIAPSDSSDLPIPSGSVNAEPEIFSSTSILSCVLFCFLL